MMRSTRHLVAFALRLSLVAALTICLLLVLMPGTAIVAAFGLGGLDCCVGKSASHCHVSIRIKRPQPAEPMCGSRTPVDQAIIVASENEADSQEVHPRVIAEHGRCGAECASCAVGSNQKNSDRSFVVTPRMNGLPLALRSWSVIAAATLERNEPFEPSSPRGPPGC
jgi:hypothetical protein